MAQTSRPHRGARRASPETVLAQGVGRWATIPHIPQYLVSEVIFDTISSRNTVLTPLRRFHYKASTSLEGQLALPDQWMVFGGPRGLALGKP